MLTAFVFDGRQSREIEEWGPTLDRLERDQLLWLAMHEPTDEEVERLREGLALDEAMLDRLRERPTSAFVDDHGERLHVTLFAVTGDGDETLLIPVECVLGESWVLTLSRQKVAVLDEFLERARGGGQIGALDAPSFVANIFDWVVTSYFRAFEEVERELEELDARVMTDTPKETTSELSRLVELRRRIGRLRRALAPHREVALSLSHPELDALSTEQSARRFADLEGRVTQALEAARETKESTFGSFDLLVTRIGQRTNDIMKVLTLVTVILLPATVVAGIMGMNFQVGLFDLDWFFWVVLAGMAGVAVAVLWVARSRAWI
jgi:magnesium/cobalt transport protein CorA